MNLQAVEPSVNDTTEGGMGGRRREGEGRRGVGGDGEEEEGR